MEKLQFIFIEAGTPTYEAMIALRMQVLLNPIGIPRSYINPEKERDDLLIGAFQEGVLVGCCILTEVTGKVVQLRQMAVESSCQKNGIGTALLAFAEKVAAEKGYCTLMMHARDAVIEFYKKSGYQISGEPFVEVGIAHHQMRKELKLTEPGKQ